MLPALLAQTNAAPAGSTASSLHPRSLNATVTLANEGRYQLTDTDKVFHIGANKAGTTSMWLFYNSLPNDWNPCHDLCQPGDVDWAAFSHQHDASSPDLTLHRVFMDNGDTADFEWLYETFPNSRFMMNVRSLRDWLISRYDMIRTIRESGGCTSEGTQDTCPYGFYTECAPQPIFEGKKCLRSKLDWTGNSPHEMRQWVYGLALVQESQLAFFGANDERKNRFVMADITDPSREEDGLRRLWWINRKNLFEWRTDRLLVLQGDAQLPGEPPIDHLIGPHNIPHMLSDPHPLSTRDHVTQLLTEWGCHAHMDALLYTGCKKAIEKHPDFKKRLKEDDFLMQKPSNASKFPSAHYYMIHGFHMKLPRGVEAVDADDGAPDTPNYSSR